MWGLSTPENRLIFAPGPLPALWLLHPEGLKSFRRAPGATRKKPVLRSGMEAIGTGVEILQAMTHDSPGKGRPLAESLGPPWRGRKLPDASEYIGQDTYATQIQLRKNWI